MERGTLCNSETAFWSAINGLQACCVKYGKLLLPPAPYTLISSLKTFKETFLQLNVNVESNSHMQNPLIMSNVHILFDLRILLTPQVTHLSPNNLHTHKQLLIPSNTQEVGLYFVGVTAKLSQFPWAAKIIGWEGGSYVLMSYVLCFWDTWELEAY